jgi:hypothetical protein
MIPILIATRYITPLRKGGSLPVSHSFDYALLRLTPHVEREEFINGGVILFCRLFGRLVMPPAPGTSVWT